MHEHIKCECDHLPNVFNIETYPQELVGHLELIDQTVWLTLQQCLNCKQLWQLDNIDRLQVNLAIKLNSDVNWRDFDDRPERLGHLISSRGGVSKEHCVMEGCNQHALKSLAHCPKHAFDHLGLRD